MRVQGRLAFVGVMLCGLLLVAGIALFVSRHERPPHGRLPGDAPAAPKSATTVTIGTSGTGGIYYPLGKAIAGVLSKYLDVQAIAEVTGGSVDNLKRIGAGKNEIGISIADATLEAFKGEGRFASEKIPLRALMLLFPNHMHVVTIEGSGVEKLADLKGKRVSTGAPGGATEAMAFRLIEAVGLDKDKDMKRERLSVFESVDAIKERKIDAFFWVGAAPTAALTDLAAAPGFKMKLIDHADAVAAMNAKYGNLYSADVIKAGSYPGQDKDNKSADIWNVLVTDEKAPDDFAYTVVKTIFEKKQELVAVQREAERLALDMQGRENSPIPFHPGAVKYFKERGLSF